MVKIVNSIWNLFNNLENVKFLEPSINAVKYALSLPLEIGKFIHNKTFGVWSIDFEGNDFWSILTENPNFKVGELDNFGGSGMIDVVELYLGGIKSMQTWMSTFDILICSWFKE